MEDGQKNLGDPSEMALLSRLHWWTVEYGLIGTLENPKIYGAGLLSSIGESVSCLEPNVKKIPYSIEAAQTAVRYHDETAAAFRLPRFPASQRCAGGIREQDGVHGRRARRNQQSDRMQEHCDL